MDVRLLDSRTRAWFRRRLLAWFAQAARVLPWRQTRDPYAIWVSEVMLQQTQVATVIPYFQRFLTVFPNVAALARATEQEVLHLWQGLGYYRRARCLHQAARHLHEAGHNNVPNDPEGVRGLPGLGRYTANALLSQAFDRRLPIIEANSERVLCRFLGIRAAPQHAAVRQHLWQVAENLLPQRDVGLFNQALMELGALVCAPAEPRCDACPVKAKCQARREGAQAEIPPPKKRVFEAIHEVAVVVRRGDRVLLAQRPAPGRWAGLWEFPRGPVQAGESSCEAAKRLLGAQGLTIVPGVELGQLRHGVTRFRFRVTCLEARYRRGNWRSDLYSAAHWLTEAEFDRYPASTPQRRLARLVAES